MITVTDFVPPVILKVKKSYKNEGGRLFEYKVRALGLFGWKAKISNNRNNQILRPCHLRELFIRHDGYIFPCCIRRMDERMIIGHLNDKNLRKKLLSFDKSCKCEQFRLRRATPLDRSKYERLNIELSLDCQANCALCCVGAPEWKGEYHYYDQLNQLTEICNPKSFLVQGGEVLIQRESMQWLQEIKKRFPEIAISIITNGSVSLRKIAYVESIFDSVTISFVGFQAETYKKIMGLDLNKALSFVEVLLKRKKVKNIWVKFLINPSNIHETDLFLDWAIRTKPSVCLIQDSATLNYININTSDDYWKKIFNRTGKKLKKIIAKNKSGMISNGTLILMDSGSIQLFGIDDNFIDKYDEVINWFTG